MKRRAWPACARPPMFNSFRVRLAFIMATLLALTTSSLSWMLGAAMSHQLAAEQGRALDNLARGIAAVMAEGMDTRLGEIARVAQGGLLPMVRSDGSLAVTDADLDRIAANRTHYSWIGVARPDGVVVASEPYDDHPDWQDVPDRHLVDVRDGTVILTPLRGSS